MQLGIFAKTFAGTDPQAVLSAARQAGYQVVQYNMACSGLPSLPAEITEEQAIGVAKAAQITGVAIAAISATYNMTHPDEEKRREGRAALFTIASKAHLMGTRLVTLCSGSLNTANQWEYHPDNKSPEAWSRMIVEFEQILPIAEEHDIILGVEPELANIVCSAPRAKQLIDELKTDRIGIVLDPANLFDAPQAAQRAQIIREAVDLLAGRVVMVHAKDRAMDGSFRAAGHGCVDFDVFIGQLVEKGFHGPLVTHGCTEAQAPVVAEFLRARLNV
jgi:sugar phosphate isomerase/epimerase